MIDLVYNTVLAIANKEQRGGISPEKFNYLAGLAVMDIYTSYDIAMYLNKANRGRTSKGLNDKEKMERERYEYFLKPDVVNQSSGVYSLPSDCNFLDLVLVGSNEVEEVTSPRQFNLLQKSEDFKATDTYPVYLKTTSSIQVTPSTITGSLNLYYVRQPLMPKWTYAIVSNAPLFNPNAGDFSDIDLHQSEQSNIIINILSQIGINLKENELVQYAELIKDKKERAENIT